MRILFIGDIVGRPARSILADRLEKIKKAHCIDLVIANAENVAGGNGITKNIATVLGRYGIDAITLGDHIWDQRCFENEIDSLENVCRPANLTGKNPGREYVIIEKNGFKLGIFSLLGQTLIKLKANCPYEAADRILEELRGKCDAIFLDFHAETTSEKVSMAWHLDGRAAVVAGTHTHTPTNDARLFPQGLAFISDVGMTGPWNSCLGRRWDIVLQKFIDGRPRAFLMAEGDERICACIFDIDESTGKAIAVSPFIEPPFPRTASELEQALKLQAEKDKAKAEAKGNTAEAESPDKVQ